MVYNINYNDKRLNVARSRLWRLNQSWVCAIIGGLGSGKSWAALEIADYIMSGRFVANTHVFFKIKDFIRAVKEGKIKRGDCIILDEVGISFSSRASMSKANRAMSAVFQIMRFKNFAVIMTVPSLKLIDVVGRDVLNVVLETKKMNREEEYSVCKYKICQHDAMQGKTYRKYARWRDIDGEIKRFPNIKIYKPRQELITPYEAMKREYADAKGGLFDEIDGILNKQISDGYESTKQGIELTCKNNHTWLYKGTKPFARCPDCAVRVAVVVVSH